MEITKAELQRMLDAAALRAIELTTPTQVVSQREASAIYGKEFDKAVKSGEIQPVSIGQGRNGKRSYRVSDILALRAYDMRQARLQLEIINR